MKKGCLVGFIVAIIFCTFSIADFSWAAQYKFKIAHNMPAKKDAVFHLWCLKFKQLTEKYTNGAVAFQVFPAYQLGSTMDMAKKLQMGAIDFQIGPANNFAALYSGFDLFSLPFLMKSLECGFAVMEDTALREELSREAEKKANIRILAYSTPGMRNMMNGKHPILKPADLKGLRMRVAKNPIFLDTYKSLGGDPIGIAPNEVFSALQTGVADGNDGGAAWAYAHKLYEVQKYYSITNHQLVVGALIVNNQLYQRLPAKIQAAINRAADESAFYSRGWLLNFHDGLIKTFKEKGLQISYPNLEPFRKAVQPVWDKYADYVGGKQRIQKVLDLQKNCL